MADYHLTRYLTEDTRVDLGCSNQTILFSRFWHSVHLFISPSTIFAFFFYCNIFYKTRPVATCSDTDCLLFLLGYPAGASAEERALDRLLDYVLDTLFH